MPAFLPNDKNQWSSTPIAMGPFKGLQGGGVAGLMAFELEKMANDQDFGIAVSASVEFLRPTDPGALETRPTIERKGRRVSVLSNALFQDDICKARCSVCFMHPIDIPAIEDQAPDQHEPGLLNPLPPKRALHGQPWMMDSFEVRPAESGIIWFRYKDDIVDGITPMARVLGPADWTHGIGRPSAPKLADPNVNLSVILSRHPAGEYIGILPKTTWMPTGIGMGEGVLFDEQGDFGKVMMSVALTAFG